MKFQVKEARKGFKLSIKGSVNELSEAIAEAMSLNPQAEAVIMRASGLFIEKQFPISKLTQSDRDMMKHVAEMNCNCDKCDIKDCPIAQEPYKSKKKEASEPMKKEPKVKAKPKAKASANA